MHYQAFIYAILEDMKAFKDLIVYTMILSHTPLNPFILVGLID